MSIVIPPATPIARLVTSPSVKLTAADVEANLTAFSALFTLPDGITVSQLKTINVQFSPDGSASLHISYNAVL